MLKQLLVALSAISLSLSAVAQPAENAAAEAPAAGKILIVVTNHGRTSNDPQTAKPTGFWLSEVSHAWTRFVDAKYAVQFASPNGGPAPIDPRSFDRKDKENNRLLETRRALEDLGQTLPLADVKPGEYEAIYFAGGHGTMWDFPGSTAVQDITQKFWEQGKVVSAVCHGPAALVNVKTAAGDLLVKGKKVAAFTDAEEAATGLDDVVPFLLESKLKEQGASVETAPNYQEKVVADGRLITGQNPASAAGVAEAVLIKLKGGEPEGAAAAGAGNDDKATTAGKKGKKRAGKEGRAGKRAKRAARKAGGEN